METFNNITTAINNYKIAKIKIDVCIDEDGKTPVLDYVIEKFNRDTLQMEHFISDCGFYTLDEVLKDMNLRLASQD